MTFEEFIIKKKIDLAQFKLAEPGLFSEFQNHFSQMGEKSFDHSKKFLFNKIRRTYHLKEEPKPVASKDTIEINEIASQAEPLISPTVEATVYTPRFRAAGQAPNVTEESTKPAYVPRFKAPAAPKETEEPMAETPIEQTPADKQKPAYVPRFKPRVIAKPSESTSDEESTGTT